MYVLTLSDSNGFHGLLIFDFATNSHVFLIFDFGALLACSSRAREHVIADRCITWYQAPQPTTPHVFSPCRSYANIGDWEEFTEKMVSVANSNYDGPLNMNAEGLQLDRILCGQDQYLEQCLGHGSQDFADHSSKEVFALN